MKRIMMLIVLLATLASLGGCFWGYPPGRDRDDNRHDRNDRYDRQRNNGPNDRR